MINVVYRLQGLVYIITDHTSVVCLIVSTQVATTALELIVTTVLYSVVHFGWAATIDNSIVETFLSQLLMCNLQQELNTQDWKSDKLYLTTKAVYAYKPGVPCIEALLDVDSPSLLVQLLSRIADLRSSVYSVRDIVTIVKAVTRVPANCSCLIDEGIMEVLCTLLESTDKETETHIESITNQITTVLSGSGEDILPKADVADEPIGECILDYLIHVS